MIYDPGCAGRTARAVRHSRWADAAHPRLPRPAPGDPGAQVAGLSGGQLRLRAVPSCTSHPA